MKNISLLVGVLLVASSFSLVSMEALSEAKKKVKSKPSTSAQPAVKLPLPTKAELEEELEEAFEKAGLDYEAYKKEKSSSRGDLEKNLLKTKADWFVHVNVEEDEVEKLAKIAQKYDSVEEVVKSLLASDSLKTDTHADDLLAFLDDGKHTDWNWYRNNNNGVFEAYPGIQTIVHMQSCMGNKIAVLRETLENLMQAGKPEMAIKESESIKSSLEALVEFGSVLSSIESFGTSGAAQKCADVLKISQGFLAVADELRQESNVEDENAHSALLKSTYLMEYSVQALEKGLAETTEFLTHEDRLNEIEDLNSVMLEKIEEINYQKNTVAEESYAQLPQVLEMVTQQETEAGYEAEREEEEYYEKKRVKEESN